MAPMLCLAGHPVKPRQPDKALHEQAWAAALVLMAFVLVASVTARMLLARSRRRIGQ